MKGWIQEKIKWCKDECKNEWKEILMKGWIKERRERKDERLQGWMKGMANERVT